MQSPLQASTSRISRSSFAHSQRQKAPRSDTVDNKKAPPCGGALIQLRRFAVLPTVAASATATTVATAETAAATTTGAGLVRSDIDLERTSAQILAVLLQCLLSSGLGRKRDEPEALRTAGVPVHDQAEFGDIAVLGEDPAQLRFVHRVREVADIQFVLFHFNLSR